MEQAFAADFSGVRVHTDTEADVLNQQLSARAFTTGQQIFFRDGEYNPDSESGNKLIAHELTHVVQQGGDRLTETGKKQDVLVPQNETENNMSQYGGLNYIRSAFVQRNLDLEFPEDIKGTLWEKIQTSVNKYNQLPEKTTEDIEKKKKQLKEVEKSWLETGSPGDEPFKTVGARLRVEIEEEHRRLKMMAIIVAIENNKDNKWDSTERDDVLKELARFVINEDFQLKLLYTVFVENKTKIIVEAVEKEGEKKGEEESTEEGKGYYDTQENSIIIYKGDAGAMADTIVFESGNASRQETYSSLKKELKQGKSSLYEYGEKMVATEAGTTLDYLDHVIKLVDEDKEPIETLPEQAQKIYWKFKEDYPAYWGNPKEKEGVRKDYAKKMGESPHEKQVEGKSKSKMNLKSSDLYKYEFLTSKNPEEVLNYLLVEANKEVIDKGYAKIPQISWNGKAHGRAPMNLADKNIPEGARGKFYQIALKRARDIYHVELKDADFTEDQKAVAEYEWKNAKKVFVTINPTDEKIEVGVSGIDLEKEFPSTPSNQWKFEWSKAQKKKDIQKVQNLQEKYLK